MKNIKKLTGIMMAGALAFSVPVPAIASGFDTSSLEALIDSGVDAVFSDPDQTVDIIMYVKDKIGQQDVTDDQIRTVINEAADAFQISLTDSEKDNMVDLARKVKDANIDEDELRSDVNAVFDKMDALGVEKNDVKGFLKKILNLVKGWF
ncbi:DUF1002 domain-containing protein [Blautia ammoniilytica]|uniref:DUF1002 domain-containing protein n=1 Tax=Blautia ammoniilytica TaxID=2981782 RepID=A0ABT2TXE2_9FIRM|nr:DUF1002 domain-containing protein [Blautia ammoniilytica]MCU6766321.1 DUF1002 domain-containing protein [Blautia ammoniilytica]SCI53539.1 Predicted secreted protein [uncultured Blautia sp.]